MGVIKGDTTSLDNGTNGYDDRPSEWGLGGGPCKHGGGQHSRA